MGVQRPFLDTERPPGAPWHQSYAEPLGLALSYQSPGKAKCVTEETNLTPGRITPGRIYVILFVIAKYGTMPVNLGTKPRRPCSESKSDAGDHTEVTRRFSAKTESFIPPSPFSLLSSFFPSIFFPDGEED